MVPINTAATPTLSGDTGAVDQAAIHVSSQGIGAEEMRGSLLSLTAEKTEQRRRL